MSLGTVLGVLSSALALAGQLAYIDGDTVVVRDLAAETLRPVGPGQHDGPPRWSPDGAWLAFPSGAEADRGIYVVRPDGSDGRWVRGTGAWNTAPAWSTEGTRLVFVSAPGRGEPGQIQVYDLNDDTLAVWAGGKVGLTRPQWLPLTFLVRALDPERKLEVPGVDMDRFLAEARMQDDQLRREVMPDAVLAVLLTPGERDGNPALFTSVVLVTQSEVLPILELADPDRAQRRAAIWGLTASWEGAEFEAAPEKSPFGAYTVTDPGDTERMAWESNESGDRELYVLGKRGIANVSNHRSADWNPVWSPDGKMLAFESFRGGTRGVYRVYTDTAHVLPVAAGTGAHRWAPAWSPDGAHLAYVSDETGETQIHVAPLDGEEAIQLTTTPGTKEAPAWRPEIE